LAQEAQGKAKIGPDGQWRYEQYRAAVDIPID
jgi:hypothetical protein